MSYWYYPANNAAVEKSEYSLNFFDFSVTGAKLQRASHRVTGSVFPETCVVKLTPYLILVLLMIFNLPWQVWILLVAVKKTTSSSVCPAKTFFLVLDKVGRVWTPIGCWVCTATHGSNREIYPYFLSCWQHLTRQEVRRTLHQHTDKFVSFMQSRFVIDWNVLLN